LQRSKFSEQTEASFNSLVWTKDPITREPLLCVAGSAPKQIKILRIDTGEPVRILPGHGKGINDLAISPLSSDLIASASEDGTIRLWNLHPKFAKQPCVAMFCGEGHKQPILATSFHPNGRWMLSGGLDTAVCLWSVPMPAELDKTEEELENHNEPRIIYYPNFYSTEVHHNYVDCLQFYGGLILSRASKDQNDRSKSNEILLWKIDGFDPNEPAPKNPPIPAPDVHTRSAFPHSERSRGFQRLLSFQIMSTDRFYHRFGLLHEPGMRPILSMGNQESKFLFWDLQRLEEGSEPAEEKVARGKSKGSRKPKGSVSSENLNRLDGLKRGESVPSSDGTGGVTRELLRRLFTVVISTKIFNSYAVIDIQFGTSGAQECS
jgi:polycomb protein EED